MQRNPITFIRQAVSAACLFCALVSALGLGPAAARGQQKGNRLQPRYISNAAPDQAHGVEVMAHFRGLGLNGDYFLDFNLQVLPRRGEASTVRGRMWGSRNAEGPIFRASLSTPAGVPLDRLLGQNGSAPQAWRYSPATAGAQVQFLAPTTLLDSIGGTGLSMFELQMPFIYWPDFTYEGITKVRGRAVHDFLMYPPADFAAAHPEIGGVRLYLDGQYQALMQAVILDPNEQPVRRLTVLDLKKLGEQWIVKSIDVRDEKTRDKVRFDVFGAALDLDFAPTLFTPAALTEEPRPPIGVTRF